MLCGRESDSSDGPPAASGEEPAEDGGGLEGPHLGEVVGHVVEEQRHQAISLLPGERDSEWVGVGDEAVEQPRLARLCPFVSTPRRAEESLLQVEDVTGAILLVSGQNPEVVAETGHQSQVPRGACRLGDPVEVGEALPEVAVERPVRRG